MRIDIDLGRPRSIQALVLVNDNLTTDAQLRFRAFDTVSDAKGPVRYDSGGFDRWPTLFSTLDLNFEDSNWFGGKPLQEDIEKFRQDAIHIVEPSQVARFWQIDVTDTGSFDIGRLFIAGGRPPTLGPEYGLNIQSENNTRSSAVESGARYFDRRETYRVARFRLPLQDTNEGVARALDLSREVGLDGEVFLILDSKDQRNIQRQSFLARFRRLPGVTYNFFDNVSSDYELEEVQ
ncbi:MAG: hypothetical protein AAF556_07955 [Pseudomonadota bacterium]